MTISSGINAHRLWELMRHVHRVHATLLDIGCGSGDFIRQARNQGIIAEGIDILPTTSPYTRTINIERFKTTKTFTVITMYHVIEHLQSPEKMLTKIRKLLKPDGILVIEVPLVGNYTEKLLGKKYFAYYDKTHIHFFTKQGIEKLFISTGFSIAGTGFTLYAFPLTILTTGLTMGLLKGFLYTLLFLPLKILTMFGYNTEIARYYLHIRK